MRSVCVKVDGSQPASGSLVVLKVGGDLEGARRGGKPSPTCSKSGVRLLPRARTSLIRGLLALIRGLLALTIDFSRCTRRVYRVTFLCCSFLVVSCVVGRECCGLLPILVAIICFSRNTSHVHVSNLASGAPCEHM